MTDVHVTFASTGKDEYKSGVFVIQFKYAGTLKRSKRPCTYIKTFYLNPLGDYPVYERRYVQVIGYKKKDILSYPPASEVAPKIKEFLKELKKSARPSNIRYISADPFRKYSRLKRFLYRYGVNLDSYFYTTYGYGQRLAPKGWQGEEMCS